MNMLSNIARPEGDPKVIRTGASSAGAADKIAKGLGWFSIGLGLAEIVAPQQLTRALGMQGSETLVRAYGFREIASGLVTLSPDKHIGLCSRLAGDALDVATLLRGMRDDNPKRGNVTVALAMVLGVTLLDFLGAQGVRMRHTRTRGKRRLYHDRSGFPKGIQAAKGAARNFQAPREMRVKPPALSAAQPSAA
jgi:hypothetical protein